MPYGNNGPFYPQNPTNNLWFGNNYSSGYSQASRSLNNPMNPNNMMQPMQGFTSPMNPVPPVNNILRVMGPESAQEYQIGPNSHVILMDSNRSVFYMKQSDDSGYSETKAYEFHEIPLMQQSQEPMHDIPQASEYITKKEFEEFKKNIEELVMNNA